MVIHDFLSRPSNDAVTASDPAEHPRHRVLQSMDCRSPCRLLASGTAWRSSSLPRVSFFGRPDLRRTQFLDSLDALAIVEQHSGFPTEQLKKLSHRVDLQRSNLLHD